MSNLKVIVDRKACTALFSGRGTFLNRDLIKSLGNARFHADSKSWEIKPWGGTTAELLALFPGIEIIEINLPEDKKELSSTGLERPPQLTEQLAEVVPTYQKETDTREGAIVTSSDLNPASLGKKDLQKWSVQALIGQVQKVLYQVLPASFCVYGCLVQVKRQQGRVFLELADDNDRNAYVSCVIWGEEQRICKELRNAGFELEPDLQVMFVVAAQVNRRGARISLQVQEIVADYTSQKLAALREVTNKKLKAEGIFNLNKQTSLPFLPKRLVVLTSKVGTVINDFCDSLNQCNFGFDLLWIPINVQGRNAPSQIVKAIQKAEVIPNIDAILIFRGGGSQAELGTFNNYQVARAICMCSRPVFSAIGHQEDQSSAQDVSFRAFGVPKDLGRFFSDLVIERRQQFNCYIETVITRTSEAIKSRSERLVIFGNSYAAQVQHIVRGKVVYLTGLAKSIPAIMRSNLTQKMGIFKRVVHGVNLLVSRSLEIRNSRLLQLVSFLRENYNSQEKITGKNLSQEIRFVFSLVSNILERGYERLWQHRRLVKDGEMALRQEEQSLQRYEELLLQLSPEVQLRRGFVIVSSGERILTSGSMLEKGSEVQLEFWDYTHRARIE